MNFNEFCNEVKNRLDERLANRKISTDIEKFNAVNKNYTGLKITYTDSNLSPVFNLTNLYTQVNSDNDLDSLIDYLYEEIENYDHRWIGYFLWYGVRPKLRWYIYLYYY